nr:nucleoside-diphosphate kinase [Anaerolineae bacterium]
MERTLVLVKPDGVQRGLIGEIIIRLERRGFRLVGMKFLQMSEGLAQKHYGEHEGKDFYPGLIAYITSGPVVAMVWEGDQAISLVRKIMGETKPSASPPGSIRGDFAIDVRRNIVHGSAKESDADREINLFFRPDELVNWSRDVDRWVFSGE